VIGTFERPAMPGAPADPMKECAREEHCFNAHHVTEHPPNLRPVSCAGEEQW
jgi:hypothetical protein